MDRDTKVYFLEVEAAGTWSWILFAGEIKNETSSTSTPPYISVATRLTKHRNNSVLSNLCAWSEIGGCICDQVLLQRLLHTLTGSSKLQHGVYFTRWPAVRNFSTAFTSHAEQQFETLARRLLHTLTSISNLQHGVYFTRWPAVRNFSTTVTSHAEQQFETPVQLLLHTLSSS